jgi:hypothetical protein
MRAYVRSTEIWRFGWTRVAGIVAAPTHSNYRNEVPSLCESGYTCRARLWATYGECDPSCCECRGCVNCWLEYDDRHRRSVSCHSCRTHCRDGLFCCSAVPPAQTQSRRYDSFYYGSEQGRGLGASRIAPASASATVDSASSCSNRHSGVWLPRRGTAQKFYKAGGICPRRKSPRSSFKEGLAVDAIVTAQLCCRSICDRQCRCGPGCLAPACIFWKQRSVGEGPPYGGSSSSRGVGAWRVDCSWGGARPAP